MAAPWLADDYDAARGAAPAAGLERFYYFGWDNGWFGMVTRNGMRLPGYKAMERMQDWGVGAQLAGCTEQPTRAAARWGEMDGQPFLIAWAGAAGARTVRLPIGTTVVGGIESLHSDTPTSIYIAKGGLSVSLRPASVRIVLAHAPAP